MVNVFMVRYDDYDGERVWWGETLNRYACEAVVELLEEDGRNPEVTSFFVDPSLLVALRVQPATPRHTNVATEDDRPVEPVPAGQFSAKTPR
jgi:hypothetical protein